MSIYSRITWVNDSPPPINASNLNHMDVGIESAHIELASQAVEIASAIGYGSTLAANIAANGSNIAAQASAIWVHDGAIASLIAEDVLINNTLGGLAGANASNTAAVASMLPVVDAHGSSIYELYATQGYHSTQIAEMLATQGYHASQLAGGLASQGDQASAIAAIIATQTAIGASQVAVTASQINQASRIAYLEGQISNLLSSVGDSNRTGNGPVDLWDQAQPVSVTATSAVPRAIGMKYVPSIDVGAPGVLSQVSLELPANEGVASPPRQFSVAILSPVGSVIAWAAPTSVPNIPTAAVIQTVTVPLTVQAGYLPSGSLQAGAPYIAVVASDDLFRFTPLGMSARGEAEALVRHRRDLSFEWALPAGLNLASYGHFDVTGSGPNEPTAPQNYPAVFFE